MTDWFKKMTPEEAAKFRTKGAKFMIIPFTIIIIFAMVLVFSTVQKSSNKQKLADGVQNNSTSQNICHKDLQQCGSGCIPSNAVCCDKTNGNSYCLWPDTLCKTNPITNGEKDRFICSNDEKVKSYDCPVGQVFCGMFCIDIGKKCCFGDVCRDTSFIDDSTVNNNIVVPNNSSRNSTPVQPASKPAPQINDLCYYCKFDAYCNVYGSGGCWRCRDSIIGCRDMPDGYLPYPGKKCLDAERNEKLYQVCE